jgi:hypothetical protein
LRDKLSRGTATATAVAAVQQQQQQHHNHQNQYNQQNAICLRSLLSLIVTFICCRDVKVVSTTRRLQQFAPLASDAHQLLLFDPAGKQQLK